MIRLRCTVGAAEARPCPPLANDPGVLDGLGGLRRDGLSFVDDEAARLLTGLASATDASGKTTVYDVVLASNGVQEGTEVVAMSVSGSESGFVDRVKTACLQNTGSAILVAVDGGDLGDSVRIRSACGTLSNTLILVQVLLSRDGTTHPGPSERVLDTLDPAPVGESTSTKERARVCKFREDAVLVDHEPTGPAAEPAYGGSCLLLHDPNDPDSTCDTCADQLGVFEWRVHRMGGGAGAGCTLVGVIDCIQAADVVLCYIPAHELATRGVGSLPRFFLMPEAFRPSAIFAGVCVGHTELHGCTKKAVRRLVIENSKSRAEPGHRARVTVL
jgi:hypothetical protein